MPDWLIFSLLVVLVMCGLLMLTSESEGLMLIGGTLCVGSIAGLFLELF